MITPKINTVMPPSSEVWFCFQGEPIFKLPGFLFLRFVERAKQNAEQDDEFHKLAYCADELPDDQNSDEIQSLIEYLQSQIQWTDIVPFITLSADSRDAISKLWTQKQPEIGPYTVQIRRKTLPNQLFRYTQFHQERLKQLFCEAKLYLPSPSQFNDPFDCSLDEETRLTFIECGMGCFSAKSDNILMFSHYANHHRGICYGVDPVKLVDSTSDPSRGIRSDIRPIWYFSIMPPLDFKKQPALCATCKHDVWSYEEEYRLFVVRGSALQPAGLHSFSADALTSIIFGCRASDECISYVKSITANLSNLKYFKADRQPNNFGVKLLRIARL